MATLASVQIWSPDGATCINSKFGHQMAPLELVPNLVTRNFTDVTLADEDTNWIQLIMTRKHSKATWQCDSTWCPTLELWNWCHAPNDQILNRFGTNQNTFYWICLLCSWKDKSSYRSNAWVRCASGNVCKLVLNLVIWCMTSLPKFQSWPPGWDTLPHWLGTLFVIIS